MKKLLVVLALFGITSLLTFEVRDNTAEAFVVPVAGATVVCGATWTITNCTAMTQNDRWYSGLIPANAVVAYPSCNVLVDVPIGPDIMAPPLRPSNALDYSNSTQKKLYCGTDTSHYSTLWWKNP